MLRLGALQHALASLYCIDVGADVEDYVSELRPSDPGGNRGEAVLVREGSDAGGDATVEVAVLLSPEVMRSLEGGHSALSRFDGWCLALEGVSHFTLVAWRAAREHPVSQLELELQAEVDKFALGLLQQGTTPGASRLHRRSRALRTALWERGRFLDPPWTEAGQRYRAAHRMAARYAAGLERRHLRDGRLGSMVDELREFYRCPLEDKRAMAAG